MKRGKVVTRNKLIVTIVIITLLALIPIYSFILIKSKLNELKGSIEQYVKQNTEFTLKLGKIKPVFFRGIELENIKLFYKRNKFLSVDLLEVTFKLKPLLTGKRSIENIVKTIEINNFEASVDQEVYNIIKQEFTKGKSGKSILPQIILNNGRIKLNLKNIKFNSKIEEISINDVIEGEVKIFSPTIYKRKLRDTKISGEFLIKTNLLTFIIKEFRYKSFVWNNPLTLNFKRKDRVYFINGVDDEETLSIKGKLIPGIKLSLFFKFLNTKISQSLVRGNYILKLKPFERILYQYGNLKVKYKDLNGRIVFSENYRKLKIKKFIITQREGGLIKAQGWVYNYKKYFIKSWFDKFSYHKYTFKGKVIFLSMKRNINKVKLINFNINKYKISKYTALIKKSANGFEIKPAFSSEPFKIYLKYNKNIRRYFINFDLSWWQSNEINKIIKILPPDSKIKGNFSFFYSKNSSLIKNFSFILILPYKVKKITGKWNIENRKSEFNIYGKDFLPVKILSRIEKVNRNSTKIIGRIIKNGRTYNFNGIINHNKKGLEYTLNYYKNIKLKGEILNNKQYNLTGFIRKNFSEGKIYLKLSASGFLNKIKKSKIKGYIFSQYENNYFNSRFYRKNEKIIFKPAKLFIAKRVLNGKGWLDLITGNWRMDFYSLVFKGLIKKNEVLITTLFKNLKDLKPASELSFNINGILFYKISKDRKYLYSNINLYKFKYKKFNLDEVYIKFEKLNDKILTSEVTADLKNGRITVDEINIYSYKPPIVDFIIRFKNFYYKGVFLNGKSYVFYKLERKKNHFIKLKVIKLILNNYKIKNMVEKIYIANKKISFYKSSLYGVTGWYDTIKKKGIFKLKFYNKPELICRVDRKKYWIKFPNTDLEYLSYLNPNIDIDGRLNGEMRIKLEPKLDLKGKITGEIERIKLNDIVPSLENIRVVLYGRESQILLEKVYLSSGKGRLFVHGFIDLKKYGIKNMNLIIKSVTKEHGFYISSRKGFFEGEIIPELEVEGNREELFVSGRVIAQNFEFTLPIKLGGSGESFFKKVNLDIDIILGEDMTFFQEQTDLEVLIKPESKLHIKGDIGGEYKVIGKIETERGEFSYFGTEFKITEASIIFPQAYKDNVPYISVKAEAVVESEEGPVNIFLTVNGRATSRLTPVLTSSPPLSQKEIFLLLNDASTYLAFNIQSENENPDEKIKQLIRLGFVQIFDLTAREKLIYPLKRKIKKFFGLDYLRVKTSIVKNLLTPLTATKKEDKNVISGNHLLAGTQLTVGKYILPGLMLKYKLSLEQEDMVNSSLYYIHDMGLEFSITKNLEFEWLYRTYMFPDSLPLDEKNYNEQQYKLKWKKRISF